MIELGGRTVIPGLNDSHMHPIRGGLNYNMELRWDGAPSLADALSMLREQARRTPPPQWVRVVGGWSEFQFAERRMPTLGEVNAAAPDTPVFILHLYARALLNGAALRAVGYTRDTPDPPGGEIQRDETVTRALDVYEAVNREIPFEGLHWFFDHCETISDRNIERVRRLGGGIAVQSRLAFQGEHFVEHYGREQARRSPPVRRMLELGVPVGAGTDATRVSSYNPWVALYWLVTGNTVGGLNLYPEGNRLDCAEALRLYTVGSSWFSSEDGKKGAVAPGQLADLAVLSADYFSVPDEEIKTIESVLTVVGGEVVYGAGEFERLCPPARRSAPTGRR